MTTLAADLAAGVWVLDPSTTRAEFRARDVLRKTVVGTLPVLSGQVRVDTRGRPVEVTAELDLAGVSTGIGRRDTDLRGRHFLDVATSPVLRFRGEPAESDPQGWRLDGVLTLKGVACPVQVHVVKTAPHRVRATTSLDRRSLGIRVPRLLVAHRVEVTVDAGLTPPS